MSPVPSLDPGRGPGDRPTAQDRLSRRTFVTRAAKVATVGAIAPFAVVQRATARTDRLEAFVHQKMVEANTPGVAVAVVRGDEIVWSVGTGWADHERGIRVTPTTVFMLASVSKTVTCAGVMALVEDGRLDLDADINDSLPFEVHIPAAPTVPVTMRMLLTHTSSILDRWPVWGTPWSDPTLYFHGDSPITLGSFMRAYFWRGGDEYRRQGNFYERAPGTRYTYSNLAVALAGYVAESVSGVDFDTWCRRRILEPLRMADSGFRLADIGTRNLAMPYTVTNHGGFEPIFQYGYPDYPDGALRTSAVHLARWLGAFMNFGSFQGARVLERETVREIRRNQFSDVIPWLQGLIWYEDVSGGFFVLGHTGGDYGVSTRMFFRPDRRVGVISLTNAYLTNRTWKAFSEIEARLFHEFS